MQPNLENPLTKCIDAFLFKLTLRAVLYTAVPIPIGESIYFPRVPLTCLCLSL